MEKIYYHLPGLFEFFDFYTLFVWFFQNENEKFYEWADIGSIYGAPAEAIWNGGRLKDFKTPNIDEVIFRAKQANISCSLTFSNILLNENHLKDTYCNMLLDKFNWENQHNSIIVNSPLLENYIRKNYPNYKIVSSTTKCITDNNEVTKELDKDYDIVVLDYNYNKDFDFLKSIKNKDKVELLINSVCNPKCPIRAKHYEDISRVILFQNPIYDISCPQMTKLFYEVVKENPLFISVDDIQNIYIPMGFKHFKIEGRTTTQLDLMEILLYYMVKPEYHLEMREKLLHCRINACPVSSTDRT